jgi:hypothetical protein
MRGRSPAKLAVDKCLRRAVPLMQHTTSTIAPTGAPMRCIHMGQVSQSSGMKQQIRVKLIPSFAAI